jgi:hypothetical protein
MLASLSHSPYGVACIRCRDTVIAPNWSEFVSENIIRHSWSCESCGSQFETSEYPLTRSESLSVTKVSSAAALNWQA